MNLEELRSVRRTERQKDSLQHLRDSFYEDVAAYIEERKAERRRAADAADDPFGDPDVGRLTDEIETAEDVVEAIYERRVGKVVKLASFAAADMAADTDGLTAEERALFEDLVERIKRNRRTVLDVLAGEGGASGDAGSAPDASPSTAPSDAAPATDSAQSEDPAPDAADAPASDPADANAAPSPDDVLAEAMGGSEGVGSGANAGGAGAPGGDSDGRADAESRPAESESDPEPEVPPDAPPEAVDREATVVEGGEDGEPKRSVDDSAGETVRDGGARPNGGDAGTNDDATDRVTLRITEDVGRILGVDEREYDLESEDVVTLPTTNAGPLLERDAAERLE